MSATLQLDLPLASLDFPGRTALYMHECAARLRCSIDQVYDLTEDGSLVAVNIASKGSTRRELRVPIEMWHRFLLARLTGEARLEFLRELPTAQLAALAAEALDRLAAAGDRGALEALALRAAEKRREVDKPRSR